MAALSLGSDLLAQGPAPFDFAGFVALLDLRGGFAESPCQNVGHLCRRTLEKPAWLSELGGYLQQLAL